jgi:CheY-like chemotaxis protein
MSLETSICNKTDQTKDFQVVELRKASHDIKVIVKDVIEEFHGLHPAIKINLEIANKCETQLTFDHGSVKQVIQSIIENAISYSSGKNVLVGLHGSYIIDRHNEDALIGAIKISVSCDGADANENDLTGTRLCVATCEDIIKLHGGEVWIKNNEYSGKLVVSFTLLYDKYDDKNAHVDEEVVQEGHSKDLNILYADDEETCLTSASMLMKDLGHKVTTASTGKEVLSKLKDEHKNFDLILLDIMMPELNGFETLCFIQEHPEYKDIPVLMQSGMTDGLGIKHAMRLGARKELLQKPFTREELIKFLNVVSKYCRRYAHITR